MVPSDAYGVLAGVITNWRQSNLRSAGSWLTVARDGRAQLSPLQALVPRRPIDPIHRDPSWFRMGLEELSIPKNDSSARLPAPFSSLPRVRENS